MRVKEKSGNTLEKSTISFHHSSDSDFGSCFFNCSVLKQLSHDGYDQFESAV